jgi:hypothetical protein
MRVPGSPDALIGFFRVQGFIEATDPIHALQLFATTGSSCVMLGSRWCVPY